MKMCKLSLLAVVILSSVHTGGLAQCESVQPTGEDNDVPYNITTEIALLRYHLGNWRNTAANCGLRRKFEECGV